MNGGRKISGKFEVCQIVAAMKALWPEFAEKESMHSRGFPTCKVGGRHQRRWISGHQQDRFYLPTGLDAVYALLPVVEKIWREAPSLKRIARIAALPETIRQRMRDRFDAEEIAAELYRLAEQDRQTWLNRHLRRAS